MPAAFSEFWYIAYHTLFWLDLYLSGSPEEDFTPPALFLWTEGNPAVSPEQPYTKEELLTYLAATRRTCHATLFALTDERAHQTISSYPWTGEQGVSILELHLYTMRHVQEHAAQLLLFLGQHGIPDEALTTVARAKHGHQT
ncbi:DinB family protein [Reticulibacter mediterranei]|uniref:DinB family protein n=1 Tax=Reticulibacter mediterranei TaxID=2778369 RepID=UPI001C690D12|nr:DinB family protein [Reticulibacter mediterranei]